jgi:hypothetical protein
MIPALKRRAKLNTTLRVKKLNRLPDHIRQRWTALHKKSCFLSFTPGLSQVGGKVGC